MATTGKTFDPADRWLVQLRWVAIAGMAATILIAQRLVHGLELGLLFGTLAVVVIVNVGWHVVVRREQGRTRGGAVMRTWVVPQILGDVVLLSAILWWAGGVHNPFAMFLAFQVALAGLLSSPRATLGVGLLTIGAIGVLSQSAPLPPVPSGYALLAQAVSLISLIGFVAVFVSVYAQRLDRLRQASARNEKLAMLGRLVGSMSHELNTPLATILLASRDLSTYGGEVTSAEHGELVRTIVSEAERAHQIIELVRGHVHPDDKAERFELTGFVRDFTNEELDRLGFAGERVFRLDGPIDVHIVKAALCQILVNVLTNASEASALGRRRRIVTSVQRAGARGVEISVEDHGPGFAPEILARLGEPFQTTKEPSTAGAASGMGLGLYVSATLARELGWTLHVHTAAGGGARVTLTIDGGAEGEQG